MNSGSKNCVIGIGNEYRQDDAIGLWIAREIQQKHLPGLEVHESSGDVAQLMELWQDADWVLAIDALSSGGVPGTVHRFEAHAKALPTENFRHSTHSLSLPEAIEMARALGELPKKLMVLGVEGEQFGSGQGLSLALQDKRQDLLQVALEEIAQSLKGVQYA